METSIVAHAYKVGLLGSMKLKTHKENKKEKVDERGNFNTEKEMARMACNYSLHVLPHHPHQPLIQYTPKLSFLLLFFLFFPLSLLLFVIFSFSLFFLVKFISFYGLYRSIEVATQIAYPSDPEHERPAIGIEPDCGQHVVPSISATLSLNNTVNSKIIK